MEKSSVAQRIRAFRKLKGYTQNELADLLGVSIAILGAIERGTRKPDAKIINKISQVLGIEPDELVAVVAR
ncbi:helix-turn-helix transcriptional regulator [Paenibacillus chondroitinus]|uniref:Helix-turn-helix transcriptional regulator n=1 Tax=Paenibacillus chondroitinus TaxID=59842 RepID=A0ABU6DGB9_9BACL|nr:MULTISPECIES: helix-turn-helix transcriptional regulator [Paenibacillus]MCY9662777.1 helix-turn-helix transcriptional regulator [Paenibacillus anseongense]MEB4796811.1 helix-turn-helix transcriptional regulator [Paenibacillus chondroitinus]